MQRYSTLQNSEKSEEYTKVDHFPRWAKSYICYISNNK